MANWRKYIFENDDEAAAQIMLAANYGGRAINITQTTAAHAFSYKITSMYKLPHGHAVAVCLPEIWDYMTNHMNRVVDTRGQMYLDRIFTEIARAMGPGMIRMAIAKFRQMMKDMQLENPMSTNKVEDIKVLTGSVNPVRLKNNPIALDQEAIMGLYALIVKN
jgi:alcohol dehydrogenase class IV